MVVCTLNLDFEIMPLDNGVHSPVFFKINIITFEKSGDFWPKQGLIFKGIFQSTDFVKISTESVL